MEYTVTYTTQAGSADTQNQAILSPPNGHGVTPSETTPVKPGNYSIDKVGLGFSSIGTADGEELLREDWEITVDATGGVILPAYEKMSVLGVSSSTWTKNGYCWYLTDLLDASDHYFTAQQLEELVASVKKAVDGTDYSGNYYIFASTETPMTLDAKNDAVLIGRNEGSENYWPNVRQAPEEGVKYKRFFIFFDSELGPGKGQSLTFRYSSTTGIGDGSAAAGRNNQVMMLTDYNNRLSDSVTQTYMPVVVKYDTRDSKSAGTVKEYTYGSDALVYQRNTSETYDNVLRWTIQVNFPDREYDDDVVIQETTPGGAGTFTLYPEQQQQLWIIRKFRHGGSASNVFSGGSAYFDDVPKADGTYREHLYSSEQGPCKQ